MEEEGTKGFIDGGENRQKPWYWPNFELALLCPPHLANCQISPDRYILLPLWKKYRHNTVLFDQILKQGLPTLFVDKGQISHARV